ncbi:MAG: glycosyltransferase family 9 protein [Acidimicrobiales bacterium]
MLLALRALKLGDLLAAVPALRALARAFPDEERVLAAPGWLAPLALHTETVHRVVDTTPLATLDPSLHDADLAVNLHGRGPQSTAILAAARPRELVAFDLAGQPAWRDDEHERARWCRLLSESGIYADPDDLLLPAPAAAPPAIAVGSTVIHPGASTASRRWPADRWAAVAAHLSTAGRTVVVTGDATEVGLAHEVARGAGLPSEVVLAGVTGILGLLAVVGGASQVLCGDTGVAHVASALGTPSVVLFGPTPPLLWGPPASGPHTVLWSGRRGDPAAERPDAGLLDISVDDVLHAAAVAPPRRTDELTSGAPRASG